MTKFIVLHPIEWERIIYSASYGKHKEKNMKIKYLI